MFVSALAIVTTQLQRSSYVSVDPCACSCEERRALHNFTLPRDEWAQQLPPEVGVPARIQRLANVTSEQWLNEFYRFGRPLIVTDAVDLDEWGIFNILSDEWIAKHWDKEFFSGGSIKVDAEAGKLDARNEGRTGLANSFRSARLQAQREKLGGVADVRHSRWSQEYSFKNLYLFLSDQPWQPFAGLFKVIYSLLLLTCNPCYSLANRFHIFFLNRVRSAECRHITEALALGQVAIRIFILAWLVGKRKYQERRDGDYKLLCQQNFWETFRRLHFKMQSSTGTLTDKLGVLARSSTISR